MLIRDQKGDQWRKLEGSPQRRREVRKWWKPSSEEAVAWWRHTLMYNYLITGWLSLYHSVLTARGGGLLSSVANPFFGPCWLYLYRARNSGLYVVWWDLILLLLTSSARPCLGPAYLCFAYLYFGLCTYIELPWPKVFLYVAIVTYHFNTSWESYNHLIASRGFCLRYKTLFIGENKDFFTSLKVLEKIS